LNGRSRWRLRETISEPGGASGVEERRHGGGKRALMGRREEEERLRRRKQLRVEKLSDDDDDDAHSLSFSSSFDSIGQKHQPFSPLFSLTPSDTKR
jgi:hypothetical protein